MNYRKLISSYLLPAAALAAMLSSNFLGHFFSNSEIHKVIAAQPPLQPKGQNGHSVNEGSLNARPNPSQSVSQKKAAVYFTQARRCEEAGQLDKAINAYQQTLIHQPDHPQALLNLAILYYRKNNWAQTEGLLIRSKVVRPNYWKNYYLLALVKMAQNDITEAIAHLERTLELNPNYRPAYKLISVLENHDPNFHS